MKELSLLQEAGFTLYEAKILLTLHKLNSATVKTIAKQSQVPQNKVYDLLKQLQDQQIVQVLPTKPKQYATVSLKQTLRERIKKKTTELESLQQDIEKITEPMPGVHEIQDTFWIMEGTSAMVNKIVETLEHTTEESIGFVDYWIAKPSNLRAVKEAIERGVKFYFLGSITEETKKYAKQFADLGVQIRHHKIEGAGYSIFDKKSIQLRISSEQLTMLWVENEQFANILREHFFTLWEKAEEVKFD